MMKQYEDNFLMSIGFMVTYRCNIACPHCIVQAGPNRKEIMKLDNAKNWILQAKKYGDSKVRCISLTGGEPFFELELIQKISEYANSLGLAVSCVTNGFWASSVDSAIAVLSSVSGIDMVSLSTDLHHQRFIPLENINNAIRALEKLGILYNIAVCYEDQNSPEFKNMMHKLANIVSKEKIKLARSLPLGRMKKNRALYNYKLTHEPSEGACVMASFPVIFPDGKVVACIGPIITIDPPHPLILGNLNTETLWEIFDRAQINPLLHAIRIWGPAYVYRKITSSFEKDLSSPLFIENSICDACYRLTTDNELSSKLNALINDKDFQTEVAYARDYYLHESEAAEALGLIED